MLRLTAAAAALSILAACDQTPAITGDPNLPLDDPAQQALVISECAIYFAAVQKLESEGRSANGNPTRDCPDVARGRQADINPRVSVPPVSPGYPETLYQRMIARGIPQDLADDIAKSQAFWNLVAQRDSAVGSF
ncbi:hypothetical protein [Cognatiyoonia sp. IB215182]|uniref:hypothetical protein n=1 Tax=Cognatiyoonia sp. IB215182 TaxID=3097353 RepID=UPI002A0CCA85|nr:hypothetical protein [Cognatiyoonia sp. IB215182]MDX8353554.1 hypothetical protein [Cognatiyoonia sp. IB215182]